MHKSLILNNNPIQQGPQNKIDIFMKDMFEVWHTEAILKKIIPKL